MNFVQDPINQTMSNLNQALPRGVSAVESARDTYERYCATHIEPQQPLGVAVDRNTNRGQIIFSERPVLLPHETFVSLSQIEAFEPEPSPTPMSNQEEPTAFRADEFDANEFGGSGFVTDEMGSDVFSSEPYSTNAFDLETEVD